MPVGDVASGMQSIAADTYLNIQPPVGEEWVIHNIYHQNDVELYLTDGTNYLKFDEDIGEGVYAYYDFHVTNSLYLAVRNTHSAAQLIGFDGIKTKVP